MRTSDVLRSLRYLLEINNTKVVDICLSAGCLVTIEEIYDFLRNEEDPDFVECPDDVMAYFLDGLIYLKRGKDESRPPPPIELPFSNNLVMKKLRVAFQLREEDMLEIIESSGFKFSKTELSAILRKKGHPNYRECGDQALRHFLKGLTKRVQQK
jgi:uncharacterized protein YehS (DUF1456 family)